MIAFIQLDDVNIKPTCWTENQHIMFEYATTKVLPMLSSNGIWAAPGDANGRSPLALDQIVEVYHAIRNHPSYEGQRIRFTDRDGLPVTLIEHGQMVEIGMTP